MIDPKQFLPQASVGNGRGRRFSGGGTHTARQYLRTLYQSVGPKQEFNSNRCLGLGT